MKFSSCDWSVPDDIQNENVGMTEWGGARVATPCHELHVDYFHVLENIVRNYLKGKSY